MFKIIVFVPLKQIEEVKNALFSAGAGKLGNYDCCSFETPGTGQFRPLAGSNPHFGKQDVVEKVEEIRLETICSRDNLKNAIEKMKAAHPYETVAFDIVELFEVFD